MSDEQPQAPPEIVDLFDPTEVEPDPDCLPAGAPPSHVHGPQSGSWWRHADAIYEARKNRQRIGRDPS